MVSVYSCLPQNALHLLSYTVAVIKMLKYRTKSTGTVHGALKFGGEYCTFMCKLVCRRCDGSVWLSMVLCAPLPCIVSSLFCICCTRWIISGVTEDGQLKPAWHSRQGVTFFVVVGKLSLMSAVTNLLIQCVYKPC